MDSWIASLKENISGVIKERYLELISLLNAHIIMNGGNELKEIEKVTGITKIQADSIEYWLLKLYLDPSKPCDKRIMKLLKEIIIQLYKSNKLNDIVKKKKINWKNIN